MVSTTPARGFREIPQMGEGKQALHSERLPKVIWTRGLEMRRRSMLLLAATAVLTVVPGTSHAGTCMVADPTVDEVVCDVVYPTVMQTVCKPLGKYCQLG